MIQMESSSGIHCWLPTQTSGAQIEMKPNIQVQYSTNNQQTMYNAPCSVYNVPTITLPPNNSQTYIIQDTMPQQQHSQQPVAQHQATFIQTSGIVTSAAKDDFLRCRHWPSCKFYTSSAQSLKNHELTHYAQQSLYSCSDCNIHFTNKAAKEEHVRRKHKTWAKIYSCSHCNFETVLLDEFSEHNVAFHLDTGSTGRVYQCHQCSYSTSWKCFMDSHHLIHSVNELDYRINKKTKVIKEEGDTKPDSKDGSPNQQPDTTDQYNVGETNNTTQQLTTPPLSTPPHPATSQQHEVQQPNIVSEAPDLSSGLSAVQGVVQQQQQQAGSNMSSAEGLMGGTVSTAKEYRCNMCHHFTTTCTTTLHQHIKSHNTCQQCGYSTNSITELSLHVCQGNYSNYTAAIMGEDFGYMPTLPLQTDPVPQSAQVQQSAPVQQQGAPVQQAPPVQPATTSYTENKKRKHHIDDDDDFEEGVYRCRKCNYGTSWKCFLDSHMLTHGAEV